MTSEAGKRPLHEEAGTRCHGRCSREPCDVPEDGGLIENVIVPLGTIAAVIAEIAVIIGFQEAFEIPWIAAAGLMMIALGATGIGAASVKRAAGRGSRSQRRR